MTTENMRISDTDLDRALDRLEPPAPSDLLRRRVETMAPHPVYRPALQRYAAAAVLAVAIGCAAVLQITAPAEIAVAASPNALPEIAAGDIALVDSPDAPAPRETLSVAGLPLE